MRIVLPTRKVSVCVSLLVQYSLILTLAALPIYRSTVRAQSKFPSSKSSLATVGSTQDWVRPTPTPPVPGIGSGGTGPDGSFNVEPPARLEGPPPGVRSADEVLNETRTQPTIPDPVPSTEGYCWPGDPACRKRPNTPLPRPTPKPTPPPRPQQASVLAQRASSLVAINGFYTEKLLKAPQLSRFWNSEPYSVTTDFGSLLRSSALGTPHNAAVANRSMSYLSADCSNAQGIASNAQVTVYIYVDGVNVGTTSIEWDESFIYDISAYVNDGAYHDISAWYYDWSWNWVEAGSTSVSGCFPNYDFNTPRLEPANDTGDSGVNPGSQNINWSVPLVSLPGRGLDLNLSLTYNSLVWTKSSDGAAMMFDADHGFPSPGFRLRFPIIQPLFWNSEAGVWSYMFVTPSGARIELRRIGNTTTYESADSSYIKMVETGGGNAEIWLKDGTQLSFQLVTSFEMLCRKIKDRNGNFISIDYSAH